MAVQLSCFATAKAEELSRLDVELQTLATQAFAYVRGVPTALATPYCTVPGSIRDAVRAALAAGLFPDLPESTACDLDRSKLKEAQSPPQRDPAVQGFGETSDTEDIPLFKRQKRPQRCADVRMPGTSTLQGCAGSKQQIPLSEMSLGGLLRLVPGMETSSAGPLPARMPSVGQATGFRPGHPGLDTQPASTNLDVFDPSRQAVMPADTGRQLPHGSGSAKPAFPQTIVANAIATLTSQSAVLTVLRQPQQGGQRLPPDTLPGQHQQHNQGRNQEQCQLGQQPVPIAQQGQQPVPNSRKRAPMWLHAMLPSRARPRAPNFNEPALHGAGAGQQPAGKQRQRGAAVAPRQVPQLEAAAATLPALAQEASTAEAQRSPFQTAQQGQQACPTAPSVAQQLPGGAAAQQERVVAQGSALPAQGTRGHEQPTAVPRAPSYPLTSAPTDGSAGTAAAPVAAPTAAAGASNADQLQQQPRQPRKSPDHLQQQQAGEAQRAGVAAAPRLAPGSRADATGRQHSVSPPYQLGGGQDPTTFSRKRRRRQRTKSVGREEAACDAAGPAGAVPPAAQDPPSGRAAGAASPQQQPMSPNKRKQDTRSPHAEGPLGLQRPASATAPLQAPAPPRPPGAGAEAGTSSADVQRQPGSDAGAAVGGELPLLLGDGIVKDGGNDAAAAAAHSLTVNASRTSSLVSCRSAAGQVHWTASEAAASASAALRDASPPPAPAAAPAGPSGTAAAGCRAAAADTAATAATMTAAAMAMASSFPRQSGPCGDGDGDDELMDMPLATRVPKKLKSSAPPAAVGSTGTAARAGGRGSRGGAGAPSNAAARAAAATPVEAAAATAAAAAVSGSDAARVGGCAAAEGGAAVIGKGSVVPSDYAALVATAATASAASTMRPAPSAESLPGAAVSAPKRELHGATGAERPAAALETPAAAAPVAAVTPTSCPASCGTGLPETAVADTADADATAAPAAVTASIPSQQAGPRGSMESVVVPASIPSQQAGPRGSMESVVVRAGVIAPPLVPPRSALAAQQHGDATTSLGAPSCACVPATAAAATAAPAAGGGVPTTATTDLPAVDPHPSAPPWEVATQPSHCASASDHVPTADALRHHQLPTSSTGPDWRSGRPAHSDTAAAAEKPAAAWPPGPDPAAVTAPNGKPERKYRPTAPARRPTHARAAASDLPSAHAELAAAAAAWMAALGDGGAGGLGGGGDAASRGGDGAQAASGAAALDGMQATVGGGGAEPGAAGACGLEPGAAGKPLPCHFARASVDTHASPGLGGARGGEGVAAGVAAAAAAPGAPAPLAEAATTGAEAAAGDQGHGSPDKGSAAAAGGQQWPAAGAAAAAAAAAGAVATSSTVAGATEPLGPAGGSDFAEWAPSQPPPTDTATSPIRPPCQAAAAAQDPVQDVSAAGVAAAAAGGEGRASGVAHSHGGNGGNGEGEEVGGLSRRNSSGDSADGAGSGSDAAAGTRGGGGGAKGLSHSPAGRADEGPGGDVHMSEVEREEWRRRRAEIERQRAEAAAEREAARRARVALMGAAGPSCGSLVGSTADAELDRRIRQRLAEHHQLASSAAAEAAAKEGIRAKVRVTLQERHRKALEERSLSKLLKQLGVVPRGASLRNAEQRSKALKAAKIRFHPDKASGNLEARVYAEEVSKLINSWDWS